jgi:preprotein translocase subunit SecG
MENVILTVHLILALLLIGVVLLQRNEGGALLSGGGAMSARGAANALTKLTWIFAIAFIATSIGLTVIAAQQSAGSSVVDRLGAEAPAADAGTTTPALPEGDLLPPTASDAPAAPPASDAPAAPPASN